MTDVSHGRAGVVPPSVGVVSARDVRNRLLVRVLELTKGVASSWVDLVAVGEEEGFDWHQVHGAWSYLLERGLCSGRGTGMRVGITAAGVDEAEALIEHAEGKESVSVPFVQNLIQVSNSNVGAVQVAHQAKANVSQLVQSAPPELAEHLDRIDRAVAELEEDDDRQEAAELVGELRELTTGKETARSALVKAAAESLGKRLPGWAHESVAFIVSYILARTL